MHRKINPEGFSINQGKGFTLTFRNGWTVSVQFGSGNYCDNRNGDFFGDHVERNGDLYWQDRRCGNAEVAAFRGDQWHKFEGDDESDTSVKGWLRPVEVANFILEIASK